MITKQTGQKFTKLVKISIRSLKKFRYGFRLMWTHVPKVMRRYRVGVVGSFDPHNCHGGVTWGWPKECRLTNLQARTIFFNLYRKEVLTLHQLIVVRKALAYAWELSGGLPGGNYPAVKEVWRIVKADKTADQIHRVLPSRIPTVRELVKAFTTGWTPESPFSLVSFCQGLVAAYRSLQYKEFRSDW